VYGIQHSIVLVHTNILLLKKNLAGMLDLLRKGEAPDLNHVLAGDTVDEQTAKRDRLSESERAVMVREARVALERMIDITESAQ